MILATLVLAQTVLPHCTAKLLLGTPRPDGTVLAGIQVELEPKWHCYWMNPGDAGIETKVQWQLPKGWKASPLNFPAPKRIEDAGTVMFVHEGKVLFVSVLSPSKEAAPLPSLSANVKMLVCQEECVPAEGMVKGEAAATNNSVLNEALSASPKTYFNIVGRAKVVNSGFDLEIGGFDAAATLGDVFFFPGEIGVISSSKPQIIRSNPVGITIRVAASEYAKGGATPTGISGVLVSRSGKVLTHGRSYLAVRLPVVLTRSGKSQ